MTKGKVMGADQVRYGGSRMTGHELYTESKCALCGKKFLRTGEHVYRREEHGTKWYCSYTCFRVKAREDEAKAREKIERSMTSDIHREEQLRRLAQAGKMTVDELRSLSSGGGGNTNPELIEWLMGYEKAFTRLMPTAKASDCKGAASTRFFGGGYYRKNLTELLEATPLGIVGRANPEYLEWFMGFPIGWTELSA